MILVDIWGKNFVMVLILKRIVGDYFKFIVSEDSIIVKIMGGYMFIFMILRKGGMVQKFILFKVYCRIVVDKLIMVI